MEIERKYLIEKEQLPENLSDYPFHRIEQGYLCTSPVVRIRRQDDEYFLTYKSKGLMAREEYNLPLTQEAYEHLKPKADGLVISKTRYLIPEKDGLTIELDVFHDDYEGLLLAEVEFPSEFGIGQRGIDMEVMTAAADLAAGSDAVILRHPESIKTISKMIKALV